MSRNNEALAEAIEDLNLWKGALRAIATGQTYQVGNRSLTRANLAEVRATVRYYENEVARLSAGRRRGARMQRFVPHDW